MFVAALYHNGSWHRAQILDVADFYRVNVSYIDYGTKGVVHMTNVRLLDKKFVALPKQAIAAKLCGLVNNAIQ